jgi:hypothetical protein
MTSKSKIVLAALVGAAVGGATIHGLHAQAKPKAYTVSERGTRPEGARGRRRPQFPHWRWKSYGHGRTAAAPAYRDHGMGKS